MVSPDHKMPLKLIKRYQKQSKNYMYCPPGGGGGGETSVTLAITTLFSLNAHNEGFRTQDGVSRKWLLDHKPDPKY